MWPLMFTDSNRVVAFQDVALPTLEVALKKSLLAALLILPLPCLSLPILKPENSGSNLARGWNKAEPPARFDAAMAADVRFKSEPAP